MKNVSPAIIVCGHLFIGDRHWHATKKAMAWLREWRGLSERLAMRLIDEYAEYPEVPDEKSRVFFCYYDFTAKAAVSYSYWNPLDAVFQPHEVHS